MKKITTSADTQNIQVDLDECSPQVQELYVADLNYQQQVQKLWADTSDDPGTRELSRRGYGYLKSLYYDMPKRASIDGKPMSTEFNDFVFFCRYVGPRPTLKHSLHRIDNDIGYRIGNVEWADKRKQAEVRRNTRHHVYLGRRMTDRTLAELLSSRGHKRTPAAVKKERQRLIKRGVGPADVTRHIFEKLGLPYQSSTDGVEAWDFPHDFHQKLTMLYTNFRGTNESRIAYFIRWLDEQVLVLRKNRDNPNTSQEQKTRFAKLITNYMDKAYDTKAELRKLHIKKIDKLLSEASAHFPPQTVSSPPFIPSSSLPPQPTVEVQPKPMVDEPPTEDYLIDREFYSGLPHLPARCTRAEEENYWKVFEARRKEFAAMDKFPFIPGHTP